MYCDQSKKLLPYINLGIPFLAIDFVYLLCTRLQIAIQLWLRRTLVLFVRC